MRAMWPRWVVAGGAGVALVVGVAVTVNTVQFAQERERREVLDCMRANETRMAIVAAFDAYTDALEIAGEDPGRTPAAEAARDRRLAAFRADVDERLESLESRDCNGGG